MLSIEIHHRNTEIQVETSASLSTEFEHEQTLILRWISIFTWCNSIFSRTHDDTRAESQLWHRKVV